MDPRVKTSSDDLRAQFDLLLKLRDREEEMNRAILGIRDLRNQLLSLEKRLGAGEESKEVVSNGAELRKKIAAIEQELIQVNATSPEDEANYPTNLNTKLGHPPRAVNIPAHPPTAA